MLPHGRMRNLTSLGATYIATAGVLVALSYTPLGMSYRITDGWYAIMAIGAIGVAVGLAEPARESALRADRAGPGASHDIYFRANQRQCAQL